MEEEAGLRVASSAAHIAQHIHRVYIHVCVCVVMYSKRRRLHWWDGGEKKQRAATENRLAIALRRRREQRRYSRSGQGTAASDVGSVGWRVAGVSRNQVVAPHRTRSGVSPRPLLLASPSRIQAVALFGPCARVVGGPNRSRIVGVGSASSKRCHGGIECIQAQSRQASGEGTLAQRQGRMHEFRLYLPKEIASLALKFIKNKFLANRSIFKREIALQI